MRAALVAIFVALTISASVSANGKPPEDSRALSFATPVQGRDRAATNKVKTPAAPADSRAESVSAFSQGYQDSFLVFEDTTTTTSTTTTITTTTTTTTPQAEIPGLGSVSQSQVVRLSTEQAVDAMSYKEDGVPAEVRRALDMARTQVGVPYEADSMKPGVGFDCSGIIRWAYAQAGIELPHNSAYQMSVTKKVYRKDLRPGDLIFTGNPVSHVALYMGNKVVLQAPATGGEVQYVRVESWNKMAKFGRVVES